MLLRRLIARPTLLKHPSSLILLQNPRYTMSNDSNVNPGAPNATANVAVDGQESQGITKSAAKKAAKQAAVQATKAAKSGPAKPKGDAAKPKKEKAAAAPTPAYVNTTPAGQKKDLSGEMAAAYDPIAVESAWYSWWEASGFFKPQFQEDGVTPKKEGTFVVPQPPPNVTGALHIGHGMAIALEDTMIRWQRMLGKTVLYAPGYDHAGIATQAVVEKRIYKATGQTRHDLGREGLLSKIMDWKEEYQQRITSQTQRLGTSCDWSRLAFTMSPQLSKAVLTTFIKLHEDGTIYRANRLVNFCVQLNTTLSNIEVDQMELTGRKLINVPGYGNERIEFGVLTSFAYPVEGSDEKLIVATTRPETMLGDTAIAVHPQDSRYTHLHGKFVIHPFSQRRIPIVCDDIIVDMEFGTGAVKITPAHDPNDYEVAVRHKLEMINILNDDGTLNENAGEGWTGMKRFSARRAVIDKVKELGLYVDSKDNPMNVPICSRSGDIIEPILKPQWYVSCRAMADEAIKRTRAGELKIRPQLCEDDWYRWLEGMQDWCISRQLWWGHRIPIYFVRIKDSTTDNSMDGSYWVTGMSEDEARTKAEQKFPGKEFTLEQDEDVLDTWFSSALWPFSIMGWPDKTPDLANFYPASVLETGWDIMTFWVSRMVIFGIKLTGQMPFKEVFCHSLVRDAQGRKMSKSLGNVLDPVSIIDGVSLETLASQLEGGNLDPKEVAKAREAQKKDYPKGIPQCGADALRMTLNAYTAGGRDVNLEVNRIEGYRHFCNKLWNATRFAMLKLGDGFVPEQTRQAPPTLVERWILDRLSTASRLCNEALESRHFMAATSAAYNFWLYELCDVYIEAMKPMTDESASAETKASAQNTLYHCLDMGLRMLHPFMPFVTEELWQRLPRIPSDSTPSISLASFPRFTPEAISTDAQNQFTISFGIVKALRSLSGQYNLTSGLQAHVQCNKSADKELIEREAPTIIALTKGAQSITAVTKSEEVPVGCISESVTPNVVVHLMVKGKIDLDAEVNKLNKRIALAESQVDKMKAQAAAPEYETKIPLAVREKNADKLKDVQAEIANMAESLEKFKLLA